MLNIHLIVSFYLEWFNVKHDKKNFTPCFFILVIVVFIGQ